MKAKRQTRRSKLPYGPNIVRAWFDTVFHYSLRGLASERDFLIHRNWTFRFQRRTLEYIGPLREHLPSGARENLEQFISFFPDIGGLIDRHDERQAALLEICRIFHEAILKDRAFQDIFETVARSTAEDLHKDFSAYFGAYSSKEEFAGILAEYLVNNVENLPSYYSTSELWNRYHRQFAAVLSSGELAHLGDRTERAGKALIESIDALISAFKMIRAELSLQLDVPYVAEINGVR